MAQSLCGENGPALCELFRGALRVQVCVDEFILPLLLSSVFLSLAFGCSVGVLL